MLNPFKRRTPLKFHEHEYQVWMILRKSNNEKIHDWEIWRRCFNILNDAISRQLDKMAIRTNQSAPTMANWLPFGRMTWSEKHNIKWTSKYKTGEKIHQEVRVTPGLNLGYNEVSKQGFHDTYQVLPKTVDEL